MSGVTHRTIGAADADLRIDRWFKRHFPSLTHGRLEKLLRTGQIRVDGRRVKSNQRLEEGQEIRIPPLGDAAKTVPKAPAAPVSERDAAELEKRILYKDSDMIVLDKPAGLAVQGGSGVTRHLDAMLDGLRFGTSERPRLAHRLDKDTAGVLVLGRTASATAALAEAFRSRETEKIYWAVVVGVPDPPAGTIKSLLAKSGGRGGEKVREQMADADGKMAITDFQTVTRAGDTVAWLELRPRTGRTHQLRVHCAELGTPILGDGKYGGRAAFLPDLKEAKHLHLFARRLKLPKPSGGELDVTAPLPPHMEATFAYFGFETVEAQNLPPVN